MPSWFSQTPSDYRGPDGLAPARERSTFQEYRTRQQKRAPSIASLIPYRPANQYRTLRQKFRAGRQIRPFSWDRPTRLRDYYERKPCKNAGFWVCGRPEEHNVLPDKDYRTARQRLPYRSAKYNVLSDKNDARCSCKTGKTSRPTVATLL